ncbi:MAG: DUF5107 domain-containing protein [Clostridia bacterium]|nr:DUF5107 domain-containing protein [Clostridia bacterium]
MKIKNEVLVINGAPLEGLNPLPAFRPRRIAASQTDDSFPEAWREGLGATAKVLPYLTQDRYSRKRIPLKLKCLTLENEYLCAKFLPEYGGRLHSLFDKENGEELLFCNPVIQPGNLAIRNAWLSGGIEWNVGNLGHTYTTCDNVFTAILQDGEGNDFLRIYEFERLKGVFWQVDFHLPEGSRHLITHVRLVNPFKQATTIYWWTNIAVPDTGKTRVLASDDEIISFIGGRLHGERLPNINAMPGADISYPSQATRSFDFFIQPKDEAACTWEASAFENGLVFYERSTPPLSCKKMFCWGNHHAGKHWQEFLSDKGNGYYVELQAGIARSQLHDKLFPAESSYEWTQCFSGVKLSPERLYDEDYHAACAYFGKALDERMSADELSALNERLTALADLPVREGCLVHLGSGFGALEIMRMERMGDGRVPTNLCFPRHTIGRAEYPWYCLLTEGVLPREDEKEMLSSFMVSEKWLPLLEKSLANEGGRTWYSLMHYGIALYEGCDFTGYAFEKDNDEGEIARRTAAAEAAWLASLEQCPSFWVYRNLAVLESQRNHNEAAEGYYEKAIAMPGAFDDWALAAEYMGFLKRLGKRERIWSLYKELPESCRKIDRVRIFAAYAAVKLGELDYLAAFFAEPHHDIREGETSLTDVWFEYCARRMARERGIETPTVDQLNELIDEAWDSCPPSEDIDFRMSFDKANRYRVG